MAINVGGPAYSATNGVKYIADRYFTGGEVSDWTWVETDVSSTKDDAVYLDERWGDFEYSIPVPNGAYDITLQFSEMNWTSVGDRKVNVAIEAAPMLYDFDIFKTVGNGSALDLNFGGIQVKDGFLTVQLGASADAGTLSGIVVKRSVNSVAPLPGAQTDTVAPSAPVNVTKTALLDNQVTLNWNAATDNVGVVGYYIYRNGAPVGYVGGQTKTYVDLGLTPDTTYTYTVSAVDGAGNQSVRSLSLAVKTYVLSGALTLSWAPPSERQSGAPISGGDIGGYAIRYKLRTASTFTTLTLSSGTQMYTLPSLVGDYEVEMAAFDTTGLYSEFIKVVF